MHVHLFTYEIEYKREYEVFHKTERGSVWATDWHEAVGAIQHDVFPELGYITVVGILLLKED